MRRSGAGRESDEESDLPSDFPHFKILDTIMGDRATVAPLHLLDSAASSSPAIAEAESGDVMRKVVLAKTRPPGPVLAAKSGLGANYGNQKWSYRWTDFGDQKWSRSRFWQPKVVLGEAVLVIE